jgi:hypothetical protein
MDANVIIVGEGPAGVITGLPATALNIDPFEPKAMKRKPRRRSEKIQSGLGNFLIGYPLLMTIVAICLFMGEFNRTGHVKSATTWVFLSITFLYYTRHLLSDLPCSLQ